MLKDCITKEFAQTEQMAELFGAEQPELDLAQAEVLGWLSELHIMSCEETIGLWEDDFGLDHNSDLTLEQRRIRVFAKKNRRLLPTLDLLERTMEALLGSRKVEITELPGCRFRIRVETPEILDTYGIAEEFFAETRPAHWGYGFINTVPRDCTLRTFFGVAAFTHKRFEMEMEG